MPGRKARILRLVRAAETEMFRAADRYDDERPGLGDRFLREVEHTLEGAVLAPLRWPLVDEQHRRRLVKQFPYSIFYRIVDDTVVVVAIAHHKRQPGYWRQR